MAGREFENRVNDADPNLGLVRFGSLKSVEGLFVATSTAFAVCVDLCGSIPMMINLVALPSDGSHDAGPWTTRRLQALGGRSVLC